MPGGGNQPDSLIMKSALCAVMMPGKEVNSQAIECFWCFNIAYMAGVWQYLKLCLLLVLYKGTSPGQKNIIFSTHYYQHITLQALPVKATQQPEKLAIQAYPLQVLFRGEPAGLHLVQAACLLVALAWH